MNLDEKSKTFDRLLTKANDKVEVVKRAFMIEGIKLFQDSLDKAYSSGNPSKDKLDAFFLERFEKLIRGHFADGAVRHHKLKQGYLNTYLNVWTDSFNGNIFLSYNINEQTKIVTLLFFGDHTSNPMYPHM